MNTWCFLLSLLTSIALLQSGYMMDYLNNNADNTMGPARFHLDVLLWNCRGISNRDAVNTLADLVEAHRPDIFIVTETRMQRDRIRQVADQLPFDAWEASETIGHRGGILLLWRSEAVDVSIMGSTEQEIHAMLEVRNSDRPFLLSAIYASPRFNERKVLWENMEMISEHVLKPWVAFGDFNEVLSEAKKLGGRPVEQAKAIRFLEMQSKCDFSDLGFSGPRFTWTNLRS